MKRAAKFARLTALAVLILSIFVSVSSPAQARDREVSVSGSCTRRVTTDRGAVVVTADLLEKDLKAAVKKATRSYERASDAIKKLKLENLELQTVEYSVAEAREWEKNRSVSKGFRARIGLRVATSDVQRLGEVTEIAAREELREVGSLTSFLSDEKIRREQDACLKDAAEHARAKAEKLATTLGAKLGEVIQMTEAQTSGPQPSPIMGRAMMKSDMVAEESSAPSIESGRQEVSTTVQISFALK